MNMSGLCEWLESAVCSFFVCICGHARAFFGLSFSDLQMYSSRGAIV